MSEIEQRDLSNSAPCCWLRSRGCAVAGSLLVGLASVCFWIDWRGQAKQAHLEYLEQLGAEIGIARANPIWLYDLLAYTFGEKNAFTGVTYIDVTGTKITDNDLQHLSGLTNLQTLCLGNTQVTDAGLQHLSGLTHLRCLYLEETQVTDAGLRHLSGLTNLQELYVDNTQVTDAAADELRSQLPGLEIAR